ncbi:MAG: hypothetical protein R3B70_32180 [Polyangiaceae bacterium]
MSIEQGKRSFFQSTYTPRSRPLGDGDRRRAWQKLSAVRRLAATKEEISAVRAAHGTSLPASLGSALAIIESIHARTPAVQAAATLSGVEASALADALVAVAGARAAAVDELLQDEGAPPEPHLAVTHIAFAKALGQQIGSTPDTAARARKLVSTLRLDADSITLDTFRDRARAHADSTVELAGAFKACLGVEPAGYLHLERMTFTPAGILRGELLSSLPLAPGEQVQIAHREWSDTSEEMVNIVTDYEEGFSEEGVTEKSEAVQAVASQTMHTSGFNTGLSASGGYGPVSVTATAGYTASESAAQSTQFARDHSMALTRRSSSRVKKEHKISFKLASSSGTDDSAAKQIVNTTDKPVRIDYYQLLRKWRVDLHRYGVRLTYDLTIPEPGADILSKVREIREIEHALRFGFAGPESSPEAPEWARFDLSPSDITAQNHASLAAKYGASIPSPPATTAYFETGGQREWQAEDMAKNEEVTSFDIEVPDDYTVQSVKQLGVSAAFKKDEAVFDWKKNNPDSRLKGRSGKFKYVVKTRYLTSFSIRVRIWANLRPEALGAWQLKVWGLLHDAAELRYAQQRQALKDRLVQLTEELGGPDPLSLRKLEREEVMKGVLAWMFGPELTFSPKGLPEQLTGPDGAVLSNVVWARVLGHGQIIQFLHHAIEWENMAYVLYPYFWSHPSRWDLKKDLAHPDFMHRAFLKSGAARVVLTVRPGFEHAFLSFMETATFDGLPADHPYVTLAEELRAFASTHYPGVPAADPEGADLPDQGERIGTWYEHTPTSAMDIAIGETPEG